MEMTVNMNRSAAGKLKHDENPRLGPSRCHEFGLKKAEINELEVIFLCRTGPSSRERTPSHRESPVKPPGQRRTRMALAVALRMSCWVGNGDESCVTSYRLRR